eukprot:1186007-Prorocentrum_minimum.AAC.4
MFGRLGVYGLPWSSQQGWFSSHLTKSSSFSSCESCGWAGSNQTSLCIREVSTGAPLARG